MQQPKPHGVAADESERHLLKKKSAEGYLDSLAQAAVSSQRLKNKLQSETGDQAGLTREQNQGRYQREGAQLIQMGEQERKIDLPNDDRDRQNRDQSLPNRNQDGSGRGATCHGVVQRCFAEAY
jgi:hypothetical protein